MLTKQRRVLQFAKFDITTGEVHFGHEDDDLGGWQLIYRMSTVDWEDMGAPDTITVNVEPGDLLND